MIFSWKYIITETGRPDLWVGSPCRAVAGSDGPLRTGVVPPGVGGHPFSGMGARGAEVSGQTDMTYGEDFSGTAFPSGCLGDLGGF